MSVEKIKICAGNNQLEKCAEDCDTQCREKQYKSMDREEESENKTIDNGSLMLVIFLSNILSLLI